MMRTLLDGIGWQQHLRPFLVQRLAARAPWGSVLGSLLVLLFLLLALSGCSLALYYSPSPDKAAASLSFIVSDVPAGRLLRAFHYWGAGAFLLTMMTHLATNFIRGSYKAPRQFTWITGVLLLMVAAGLLFTGSLLPWSARSYSAAVVTSALISQVPIAGRQIACGFLGGYSVSGLSLTRFYVFHILFLPALLMLFAAVHVYLVRCHGLDECDCDAESAPPATPGYRFFPEHVRRLLCVFVPVLGLWLMIAILGGPPHSTPLQQLDGSYEPRPEWFFLWLFQLLTFFPGRWEWVGSLLVPGIGLLLLFAVPFLDNARRRRSAGRPLATAVASTAIAAVVYLTLSAWQHTLPYNVSTIASRPAAVAELRGRQLYAANQCGYCHTVKGLGGRPVGPDLSNLAARGRTPQEIAAYVRNPRLVTRSALMPAYRLSPSELADLASYIQSLDSRQCSIHLWPKHSSSTAPR
ncbi:MAG: cytochrome b N-terminal domain-containing protein [Acidobacteriota bacterium]|nr:cytochrome b N-terminal domain-containing protein [Acidobacteriota bacterium]